MFYRFRHPTCLVNLLSKPVDVPLLIAVGVGPTLCICVANVSFIESWYLKKKLYLSKRDLQTSALFCVAYKFFVFKRRKYDFCFAVPSTTLHYLKVRYHFILQFTLYFIKLMKFKIFNYLRYIIITKHFI